MLKCVKCVKTESFIGLFGNTLLIDVFGTVNKVTKKIVGEMWCKKIFDSEVKTLFESDSLIKHIDYSLKELGRGQPFSILTSNKKTYSFRFGNSKLLFMTK